MKVVLISGGYPPVLDGVGDYTHKIFDEMHHQIGRDSVHVVTRTCEGRENDDPHVLSVVEKWNLRGIRNVLRAIGEIRPDIAHIQYSSSSCGRSLFINSLAALTAHPPSTDAGDLYDP